MDVLHPQLINIEGRIYCKYATASDFATQDNRKEPEVCWDDEPDCDATISKNRNGRYESSLSIPSALFKHVIGKKGIVKHKIEQETHTKIIIPEKGCEGNIVVIGDSSASVASAKSRIEILVSEKRWREPFTHFVSIPLTGDEVKSNFEKFKSQLVKECDVDAMLFQNPQKLHLTICTLVLLNDTEVVEGINAFKNCVERLSSRLLKDKPKILVKGLEYMNDDPGAVDVLYAKVSHESNSNTLQEFADEVARELSEAGLSEKQYDRVKLHGTLLNTTFRKARSPDKNRRQKRETFNAEEILKRFSMFEFGTVPLDRVCLSARFTTDSFGYYSSVEEVAL